MGGVFCAFWRPVSCPFIFIFLVLWPMASVVSSDRDMPRAEPRMVAGHARDDIIVTFLVLGLAWLKMARACGARAATPIWVSTGALAGVLVFHILCRVLGDTPNHQPPLPFLVSSFSFLVSSTAELLQCTLWVVVLNFRWCPCTHALVLRCLQSRPGRSAFSWTGREGREREKTAPARRGCWCVDQDSSLAAVVQFLSCA